MIKKTAKHKKPKPSKEEEKKEDGQDGAAEESVSLEEKLEELQNELLLQRADFENIKKRIEKEKWEEIKYASLPLIIELLGVIDNLELALSYAKKDDPLKQGVRMALDGMKKVLEQFNLIPIKAVGEKFDPSLHEAVLVRNDSGSEEDIILEEINTGYMFYDRVVRASKVMVNRPAKK